MQLNTSQIWRTTSPNHNRAISTMQVIEVLIQLAKELDAATKAGKELGLTDDEKAFYTRLPRMIPRYRDG
jgi:type I restriction enzyme, R subunit